MEFSDWFQRWLSRHPLREPTPIDSRQFTYEVMERIESLRQSAPRPLFWVFWPRLLLATATAAALFIIVSHLTQTGNDRLARQPPQSIPNTPSQPVISQEGVVLAEDKMSDEDWIAQTLWLLQELDDEDIVDDKNDGLESDEEWLEELEELGEDDGVYSTPS